jgi:UDP-N-acetylmuramoyl-tripeptide--D-alanyl-D-alanine ligase
VIPYATLRAVTVDRPIPPGPLSPRSTGPSALTADDLVRLSGGRLLRRSQRAIVGGAVDSRLVASGSLFVALPGERTDGHRFANDAIRAGAAALLVSRPIPDLDPAADVTVVAVPDALVALGAIAAGWRARFDPLVVGVTGSVGKTSVKEAVAAVLGASMRTLRTEGNQNNEIGLPLTLLRLTAEHRAAVLEMGMYVGGDIADLATIARPHIGVVTAVAGVHLSRIGTIAAIEQEKGRLVEALPSDGVAVLNADDRRVRRMAGRTAARVVTYGFARDADVHADDVEASGFDGMRFTLRVRPPDAAGRMVRAAMAIPNLGRLSVHNALAAAAVGLAAGLPLQQIRIGLAGGWSAPHRGAVVRAGGVTIVDDAYNASPVSVAAALDLLAALPGRHVAVLGEMRELGRSSAAGHHEAGRAAAGVAGLLVVVGEAASAIVEGAVEAGMDRRAILLVPDRDAALDALRARLRERDVVLVKASRGAELDRLVDALVTELGGTR